MATSRWNRWITTAAVLLLALIAAVVSYSHMYEIAASMSLLSDARQGRRGGLLPWSLLILGSPASLAANFAVADPT